LPDWDERLLGWTSGRWYIPAMPLSPGSHLGPYQIRGLLGAGGMGEVYRAHDARLGRDVAIKVLPTQRAASPDVRARFEREARTVSQLNHPHICTLYDLGHQDGIDYLVMELIEGGTLAERLAKGPLPLGDVLTLGRQIAGALDRAHRAGIVHRDLKPGNVMLTKSGAKLMDFGLARSTGLAGASDTGSFTPTQSRPLTAEGTIVGTFQYMAPEQLEGKESDARSDIWALGCVLYEMVTGKRAFHGESQASLIAAIISGEPRPIADLSPVTPPSLQALIRRCIHKDPDARFQSALDVGFMLELVAGETPGTAVGSAAAGRRGSAVPAWLLGAAAIAIAVGGFLAGRMTAPPSGQGAIRVSTLSQGSRDNGPAVSPDGRWIAFSAVRQNGQGVWLMDMVTRSELKLTDSPDQFPRFTADGGSIVFTRIIDGRLSVWRIPVIGGKAKLLVEDAFDADPSPDGTRIAYIVGTGDSAGVRVRLMVANSDGTGGREVWSRSSTTFSSPRWSPDGRQIAVNIGSSQNAANQIAVIDVATGRFRAFPSPNAAVLSNVIWEGRGNRLIVAEGVGITAVQRGAPGRLLGLDTRSGAFQPLGWLENFPVFMDMLPDGRLVLSSLVVRQNLFEAAVGAGTLNEARRLTSGLAMDRQPVYSPDGRSVMFSSNRGGTLDLWEVSTETGEMHRVTDDPQDDWDPEYGPDGESIFWCSGRSGAFEIWTARRDGTAPRQLSRDSLDAENPSVAPDGRWVIYSSAHPGKSGLWRVPAAGGEGEWVLKAGSLIPDLSPDGRFVSTISNVGTIEARLTVFDLTEKRELGSPVPLQVLPGTVQTGRSRFTPDGNAIAYAFTRDDGRAVLLRRPLSAWRTGAGSVDTLFARSNDEIESFGFSPDGTRMALSVVDWLSSLTIADRVPGIAPPKRR
jgi:Tol biopolymer transport system component